jgi:hypothetical protein
MNPTKHCFKGEEEERKWEYNGRGELVQSILYSYIEFTQ